MNILYIWDADYPWDVRVEKISNALMSAGHEVHVASRNLKKKPVYEKVNDLHIHRTNIWRNDKLNYFFSFPLFCSPIWKRFLDRLIEENNIDVIIVRDLPLAIAGIWAGRRYNVPVIFDMAEDYVAMVRDIWKLRKFKGLNLLVRNPYLAKMVEKYTFSNIDHTLVVIDEAIDVVVNGGGNVLDVSVVSNTPDLEVFSSKRSLFDSEAMREMKESFSVIYTGGIQLGRGLQLVVEAMPKVIKYIPNFRFVVVGDGYAVDQIKKLVSEKGLGEYVIWVGWVSHEEIYSYISSSSVGIIPHYVTDHVKTTIPNKIFDYMGCGIPVIASDSPPMKKIIDDNECGLVFRDRNVEELANSIISLYNSDINYGENGKKAVFDEYNWSRDTERLFSVINKLASK